jgi:hypothetical protein
MGPIGMACNFCWKQKQNCTNGKSLAISKYMQLMNILLHTGHRHCPTVVKKELKPLDTTNLLKCKVYSTASAHPIGHIDTFKGDFDTTPGSSKCQKTASGVSAQVQFDGVVMHNNQCTRATRKSMQTTRVTSKKDINRLFERLGQEFQAIVKTCEDIAEALN